MAVTAPKHLTAQSKRIYRSVVDDYDLAGEPHAREVLRLALEALDAADTARKIVEAEGMIYVLSLILPPLCRLAAWRGFRELSLDAGDYVGESRVPRAGSGALS